MFRGPNRLLIILLVLQVGVGPIGSVIAGPHSCAPGAGQSTVIEGMVHGDHGYRKDAGYPRSDSLSDQNCDDCGKGCCQGGLCAMGHCGGTAAVLQTSITLAFERLAVIESTLTGDRPLSGPLSPPLRPPQA